MSHLRGGGIRLDRADVDGKAPAGARIIRGRLYGFELQQLRPAAIADAESFSRPALPQRVRLIVVEPAVQELGVGGAAPADRPPAPPTVVLWAEQFREPAFA